MDIGAAIHWVEDHIDYGSWAARSGRTGDVDLSLDRMVRLMGELGNPQSSLNVIHVSGTNGKGSTSKMITRLLMAAGLRVGTYSSPHLSKYNERFRIDDAEIDDGELAEHLSNVADAETRLDEPTMPFELLTAAAFEWFAARSVDVAVVEVGVLGRFDATNVANGRVAVVTNIGFDHTNGEGDWQARIAEEKAGIVKPGAHLILGPIDRRLHHAFEDQRPTETWRFGTEIVLTDDRPTSLGRHCTVSTPWQSSSLDIPLHGAHQSVNAALAIAAASAFVGHAVEDRLLRVGLDAVQMPARLEFCDVVGGVTVILDGAHNPDAAAALARSLRDDIAGTGRRTLMIGLLAGRDPATMLAAIDAASFDRVITCTPPTARARSANDLRNAAEAMQCPAIAIDDVTDALRQAIADANSGDQIVVTGSIYLVADARAWLTTTNPS